MVFKGIYSNQLVIFRFKIEFVQRKNLYILKFEEKKIPSNVLMNIIWKTIVDLLCIRIDFIHSFYSLKLHQFIYDFSFEEKNYTTPISSFQSIYHSITISNDRHIVSSSIAFEMHSIGVFVTFYQNFGLVRVSKQNPTEK